RSRPASRMEDVHAVPAARCDPDPAAVVSVGKVVCDEPESRPANDPGAQWIGQVDEDELARPFPEGDPQAAAGPGSERHVVCSETDKQAGGDTPAPPARH